MYHRQAVSNRHFLRNQPRCQPWHDPDSLGQPQAELVLHFAEIGQGDCTLIECPATGEPWDADGNGVVKPGESLDSS